MPEFVFRAPSAYDYPATRDAKGFPLGTVEPGDVRDLDEAPDRWWVPVEGGTSGTGDSGGSESTAGGSGTSEGDAPEPASEPDPSAPVPAPPAVIANP